MKLLNWSEITVWQSGDGVEVIIEEDTGLYPMAQINVPNLVLLKTILLITSVWNYKINPKLQYGRVEAGHTSSVVALKYVQ